MSCPGAELPRPYSLRSDDEKTVCGEHVDHAYSREKDAEAGARPEDANVQTREQAVESTAEVDEFPDGGFKAWLIIFGVRVSHIVLRHGSYDRLQAAFGNAATFGYANAWGVSGASHASCVVG